MHIARLDPSELRFWAKAAWDADIAHVWLRGRSILGVMQAGSGRLRAHRIRSGPH
jgi:hypothetical protein